MMRRELIRTLSRDALDTALALVPAAAFVATVAVGLLVASPGRAAAGSIDIGRAGAAVCAGRHDTGGSGVAPDCRTSSVGTSSARRRG